MAKKLTNYFQNIADVLDQKKKISEVFPNNVDSGQTREGILKQFLQEHLPLRCKVVSGGFIFNSNDEESSQIDLIILHDLTLQFDALQSLGLKTFAAIEGCMAAISVKTNLDKEQLENSLDGFATIPKMPKLTINPQLITDIPNEIPLRIIFAFTSLKPETIKSHLEDYYKKNPTPIKEQVRFVLVNNNYIITRTLQDNPTNKGDLIPANTFFISQPRKYSGAYGLHFLITELQRITNIIPHLSISFGAYLDNTLSDQN